MGLQTYTRDTGRRGHPINTAPPIAREKAGDARRNVAQKEDARKQETIVEIHIGSTPLPTYLSTGFAFLFTVHLGYAIRS